MNELIIDKYGTKIWYDMKSDELNLNEYIWYLVRLSDQQIFYVRPHRENDFAIIFASGVKAHIIHGLMHCENGPAEIHPDGNLFWGINDIQYSFEGWCKELDKSEEEINFLKLKYNIW